MPVREALAVGMGEGVLVRLRDGCGETLRLAVSVRVRLLDGCGETLRLVVGLGVRELDGVAGAKTEARELANPIEPLSKVAIVHSAIAATISSARIERPAAFIMLVEGKAAHQCGRGAGLNVQAAAAPVNGDETLDYAQRASFWRQSCPRHARS